MMLALIGVWAGGKGEGSLARQRRKLWNTRSVGRIGRMTATLTVLPALLLSPLTTQAILIHDHHGHETHAHAIRVHELDELVGNPEQRHEEHEHDTSAVGDPKDDGSSVVILLDLPDGLARSRVASGGGTLVSVPSVTFPTNTLVIAAHPLDRPSGVGVCQTAPPLRAGGSLEGILLTSHALLL